MQAQNGPKRNLTDEAEMRASKRPKGDKADIPAPNNIMTSSPSQRDDQETSSSIKNKGNCQVDEPKDIPCPSSAPGQTGSDGKEPDKDSHRASVEEVQDKDEIPGLSPIDDDDEDVVNDITDREKSASTAAAVIYTAFTETNISGRDPKSLKEAMSSPEWPKWEKAIQIELETLTRMGTWELVNAPEDRKPITNKWVFVRKYDKDGNLQKYKARLVARGFSQMPGMDYNETFSPVMRLETIRVILVLTVTEDWEIQQMDIKGAYLNGKLKETIYSRHPHTAYGNHA